MSVLELEEGGEKGRAVVEEVASGALDWWGEWQWKWRGRCGRSELKGE